MTTGDTLGFFAVLAAAVAVWFAGNFLQAGWHRAYSACVITSAAFVLISTIAIGV